MRTILLLTLSITFLLTSCESQFDKKIRRAVEYVNANLPKQANDWMWKDSVSYNSQERTFYHYFSFRVDDSKKELFRKILMNDQLAKNLLLTEDVSIYLENNISMGVISTFGDGEVVSKVIITPDEMKKVSNHGISHRDLTEYIYANMAISMSAICPYRIDECTTITQADFDREKMELFLYWDIDDYCMPYLEEQTVREIMKEYITGIVQYNHKNLIELEKRTTPSTYKRSAFPVTVTLVCNSSNGLSIKESVLSTNVTLN